MLGTGLFTDAASTSNSFGSAAVGNSLKRLFKHVGISVLVQFEAGFSKPLVGLLPGCPTRARCSTLNATDADVL